MRSIWHVVICGAFFTSFHMRPATAQGGSENSRPELSFEEQKRIQEDALSSFNNSPGAGVTPFTTQEILSLEPLVKGWEVPYNFTKRFPVYLAGYDEENRPIWIGEFGKWDLRSVGESTPEEVRAFEKYFLMLAINVLKSVKERSTPEEPVNDVAIIIDYEGVRIEQALSLPTLRLLLKISRQYREAIIANVGDVMVINVNAVAQIAINLTRPLFAVLDDRLEIHGTNKARWMPVFRKKYPLESIPTWYGGRKDYRPIKIIG